MDEKSDWRVAENRLNWDDRAQVHATSPFYEVERLVADRSYVSPVARRDYDVLRPHLGPDGLAGRSLLHLQCHIGTDTLCWRRLGAAEVWGLDFSPASLAHAREIASRAGEDVSFVEGDARRASEAIDRRFDVVVTGTGALEWLPELASWARSAARLLRPGGVLLVRDDHPLLGALVYESLEVHGDYLSGSVDDYEDDGSYVPGTAGTIAHTRAHNWSHDFQEVLGSLLAAGLSIEDFRESPYAEWRSLPCLVETPDGWTMPAGAPRIPLTFAVVARRPA